MKLTMENKTDFPPFYSGQKVVVIKSTDIISIGEKYQVLEITQLSCGCWCIKISISRNGLHTSCFHHPDANLIEGDWYCTCLFAPIESTFKSITFKQVVEIESPLISMS